MVHDRTDYASGFDCGFIFGQLYHTPVSILEFWACGIADGDWIYLDNLTHMDGTVGLQTIYSVQATYNTADYTDFSGIIGQPPIDVFISGVAIFPFHTSGLRVNYLVFGHKSEDEDAALH